METINDTNRYHFKHPCSAVNSTFRAEYLTKLFNRLGPTQLLPMTIYLDHSINV